MKTPREKKDPDPEKAEEPEPEPKTVEEVEEEAEKPKRAHGGTSEYVNIYTWGVRDVTGAWVTIAGDPNAAPMDRRQVAHLAENLTHREALEVFEKHLYAAQLIDGCDVWACLSDEAEVFVIKKEKKNVPAPEAVQGAGLAADGPGHDETPPPSPSGVTQGAA